MSKVYLGFSLGFNSSAALFDSEKGLLKAISQERVINVKNTKEFPIDAMIKCCKDANVSEIDYLCFSHYQELSLKEMQKTVSDKYKHILYFICKNNAFLPEHTQIFIFIKEVLSNEGIYVIGQSFHRTDHHLSHALSCIPFYGFSKNSLFVTSDGFGDGVSQMASMLRIDEDKGEIEVEELASNKLVDSIGLIYQFTTGALGFKEHQHEGKITGLAAFGAPIYTDLFLEKLYFDAGNGEIVWMIDENKLLPLDDKERALVKDSKIIDFDKFLRLKKTVYKIVYDIIEESNSMETIQDIASSIQTLAELFITESLMHYVKHDEVVRNSLKYNDAPVCYLAGGLFANVKLNQRIREMNLFSEVCVAPPMGDEGTAIGSIMCVFAKQQPDEFINMFVDKQLINMPYLGTSIDCELYEAITMRKQKSDVDIKAYNDDELALVISKALANKKIVCLCKNDMEFGPRALCNRSILYDCTDKQTNDWLNKQLNRTEFMPFAPVCLDEDASDLFIDYESIKKQRASSFMTMTYRCKKEFIENYPAACHVDNTARPQVVSKSNNAFIHKVLKSYKDMTGLKVLINTSFNLHNYPIVENKNVAFDSWFVSNTDMLVIGNVVFEMKNKNAKGE